MKISSQISWRHPPIDEEGSNIQINDLEEEARAFKAKIVSVAPEKTRIKIRVKVPKQQGSDEDEDEDNDDSNTKAASESSNLYDSSEISRSHICPECEKGFPSLKSLYGHLRSHPNRGYRGANPPASKHSKRKDEHHDQILTWSQTPKRTRSGYYDTREVESAMTLILISRGLQPKKSSTSTAKKSYKCSTCNKSFSTHQALGGHVASHNKHKHTLEVGSEDGSVELENDRDEMAKSVATVVHRCEICNKVFGSGQALGGHKRMHYAEIHGGGVSVVSLVGSSRKQALNDFDLNEPPRFEEEEEI